MKQQQYLEDDRSFQPGKLIITPSESCRPKIVNFFGDVNTECFCLHTSRDDLMVAAGCSNGDVRVYNILEGSLTMMANSSRLSGYPNTAVKWNPAITDDLTACNCDGSIKWYTPSKEQAVGHYSSKVGYLCAEYNCDGSWTAYGDENHTIQLFDSATKKLYQTFEKGSMANLNPNHTNRVFSLKSIKDEPHMFLSAAWDNTVRVWDTRAPYSFVRKFSGPSVSADSMDKKGSTLLVGNYDNRHPVQLWDFGSGLLLDNIDVGEKENDSSYCFAASYAQNSSRDLFAVALSGVNKVKIMEGKEVVS